MSAEDFIPGLGPLWLSFQLAAITVVLLLLLGTPLAWRLAHMKSRFKPVLEAIVALPLVLPPTVLGFYLLLLLGPQGLVGAPWVRLTGEALTFSFSGLVLASMVYSAPFVIQPLQTAFETTGREPWETARTLGAGRLDAFLSVVLPLSGRGFLSGGILGFAHTLGEFGVVLMVGGNIPGRTRVISIAIYDHVETLDYRYAHNLSALLVALAFILMLGVYAANRRWRPVR